MEYDGKRLLIAFARVFNGPDAEIVLDYLSKSSLEFAETFSAQSERLSCHNAGRRSLMLDIRRKIKEGEDECTRLKGEA